MPATFLNAKWEQLIMVNYEIDPEILKSFLPPGVVLDTYDNRTFVSLVGFMFMKTSIFGIPVPFFGSFEEINLRFYVKRIQQGIEKRGVVFINETVPFKAVAWLANTLYKEHYISIPTKHLISRSGLNQKVQYDWKRNGSWNQMKVTAENASSPMAAGSMEEFIFEHYYGYTKVNESQSQEYEVRHPRWEIHKVLDYAVDCDFEKNYGQSFSNLSHLKPHSVFLAKGSGVSIDWKRETF